jgi:8-oxo-dGTP pyrophosphatase MutT (NUDIX family)
MAEPKVPTTQYISRDVIVAAGSVLFRKSPEANNKLQICLLYQRRKEKWLLPKGRKDCGESIEATAVRETFEETGYPCELLPCTIHTCHSTKPGPNAHEVSKLVDNTTEPIAVTVRHIGEAGIKMIWWFITRVTGEKVEGTQMESEAFDSHFVDADKAAETLTFKTDRDIVLQALAVVKDTEASEGGKRAFLK